MRYFLLLMLLIPIHTSYGQLHQNTNDKTFMASGDAILRVQPDQVVLSLGVESRGKELVATKNKNYKIIEQAINYCKQKGVAEKHIQTDYIRINPYYHYGNNENNATINYYNVVQSLSIVIEDLASYEAILTELLNLGINKVNNVEFRTTKLKENRLKVRKMAIDAAKEKAKFLTEEVGITLGKIVNIGEYVTNPVNSFSRANYANVSQNMAQNIGVENGNGTLAVGMLSLKATINLTYKIIE